MKNNAAERLNFVSEIYTLGINKQKFDVLSSIPEDLAQLHREGFIHIHDLETFGKVYNCSIPNLRIYFSHFKENNTCPYSWRIITIFNRIKELIVRLGVSQSGGIGFANFDQDIGSQFEELGIEYNQSNISIASLAIEDFIKWLNTTYTRYNREPYYVSLNIGLSTSLWGRFISEKILIHFNELPYDYTRPNIIFKVSKLINSHPDTVNYSLFELALKVTSKRMIPTYLLMDSSVNISCDPWMLAIMGCRTRVYQNEDGEEGAIGRGNISCVSINLPRIAIVGTSIDGFFHHLHEILKKATEVLLLRAKRMRTPQVLTYVFDYGLWNGIKDVTSMIHQGTHSIGFIGLHETIQILTGKEMQECESSFELAKDIVKYMRCYVDQKRSETKLNFSLLASPGEMLSGRFCALDKQQFNHHTSQKDFYTNSFHIKVDSKVPLLEKIRLEGGFHSLCNGGSITYVEFREAPSTNILALKDAISFAEDAGVSYLGFNYPLDICRNCGYAGTFDICPRCEATDIQRIRRVSGYLENLEYFTAGKYAEVIHRMDNSPT